jgi:uncharacterized membrane protein YqaE (UPF0057 family)
MRYLLAIILPPLAVLLCGKPFQALINVLLTACLWFPGMIHALFIVNSHLADQQANRVIMEMRQHQFDSVLRRM